MDSFDDVGEQFDVTIKTVTYHSVDNGYTVARADVAGADVITIVGTMVDPHPGISLTVSGQWSTHPQYGEQFKLSGYHIATPKSEAAIEAFLSSGIIDGVGPSTAKSIVAKYGADTLDVIENQPELLLSIKGIGKKTLSKITKSYDHQRGVRELMLVLSEVGISSALAGRIWQHFEDKSVWVVQKSPYKLTEVSGIGFVTADQMAKKLGVAHDDPERIRAGLHHVLDMATTDGHCYLPADTLVTDTANLLSVDADVVRHEYDVCVANKSIVDDDGCAWLQVMWRTEEGVAHHLQRLTLSLSSSRLQKYTAWSDDTWASELADVGLADAQAQAVRMALTNPVSVLTGGPGCGKTYTVNTIVRMARDCGAVVKMAAPTGRAAKRMSEQCGVDASTIHRMLNLQIGGDTVDVMEIRADIVIIDESSMQDIHLAYKLVKAIQSRTHIVFVGDDDQLPSVGPGKFLTDLIDSQSVPVTKLTQVFRQASRSGIVQVAHQVNSGTARIRHFDEFDDIYWWSCSGEMEDKIIDMVCDRIPQRFGIATDDIQVLAPMKKGSEGVNALNTRLQNVLNPACDGRDEQTFGDTVFRVGDRVMQTSNNYDKNIFNGTPARINSIHDDDGDRIINLVTDDGDHVMYEPSELGQLMHSYAITIHKSQGSEYPAVVIPMTSESWIMWRRNLLYTAITRARSLVVLLGDSRVLGKAVTQIDTRQRFTALRDRLSARVAHPDPTMK